MFNYKAHWTRDNMSNIIPGGHGRFPEGWNPLVVLNEFYDFTNQIVLDYGCGYGRLCDTFDPLLYIGVDINPKAVKQAKQMHPKYCFEETDGFKDLPKADALLAYTVFNHLDVEAIKCIKIPCDTLIQCEILGQEWSGKGPVSHGKTLKMYEQIFHDFKIMKHDKLPYARYATSETFMHRNTDMSLILWRRTG